MSQQSEESASIETFVQPLMPVSKGMHRSATLFVVGTQQPILYITARPIPPWLPKANSFAVSGESPPIKRTGARKVHCSSDLFPAGAHALTTKWGITTAEVSIIDDSPAVMTVNAFVFCDLDDVRANSLLWCIGQSADCSRCFSKYCFRLLTAQERSSHEGRDTALRPVESLGSAQHFHFLLWHDCVKSSKVHYYGFSTCISAVMSVVCSQKPRLDFTKSE
jgi:hypothetical protein